MALSAVSVSWVDYQERVSQFNASRMGHSVRAERANMYGALSVGFERPPTPLSLLSRGIGEELGSSANIGGLYGGIELGRRNRPLVGAARRLNADLSYALALLVGFTCVFFGHGVINGERAMGTLKQQLSRGLQRSKLLVGEFIGGLIIVVLPLGLLLLCFSAWAAIAGPALSGTEWVRVAMFFLVVILYGSFWLALALTLSVLCRHPETSLLLGVLTWVFAATLYSPLAGWVALRGAPSVPDQLGERLGVGPSRPGEVREARRILRNARTREYALYRDLASLAPVTAFLHAGQAVATTSADDHLHFLAQVDTVEKFLIDWQSEKVARHPAREWEFTYGWGPLDIAGLPEPAYTPLSIGVSIRNASLALGALAGSTVLLLTASFVAVERLDVR